MRSQLLRRSADLKKNVSGSQKYLDVLREMSAVVRICQMLVALMFMEGNIVGCTVYTYIYSVRAMGFAYILDSAGPVVSTP